MASFGEGLVGGATKMTGALANYAQVVAGIEDTKQRREMQKEQITYQRGQDQLRNERGDEQMQLQRDYFGLAKQKFELGQTANKSKSLGDRNARIGDLNLEMAKIQQTLPTGSDPNKDPRYSELRRQRMELVGDEGKTISSSILSFMGQDKKANRMAKITGAGEGEDISFDKGNLTIGGLTIPKSEIMSTIGDVAKHFTHDPISNTFFNVMTGVRHAMDGKPLAKGEKHGYNAKLMSEATQRGDATVGDDSWKDMYGIVSRGGKPFTVDANGKLSPVNPNLVNDPKYLEKRGTDWAKQKQNRQKMIEDQVSKGNLKANMKPDGTFTYETVTKPKNYDDYSPLVQIKAQEAITRLLNSGYINFSNISDTYLRDEDGNMMADPAKRTISKTLTKIGSLSEKRQQQYLSTFLASYQGIYDKAITDGKSREEAAADADAMLLHMVPDQIEALQEAAEEDIIPETVAKKAEQPGRIGRSLEQAGDFIESPITTVQKIGGRNLLLAEITPKIVKAGKLFGDDGGLKSNISKLISDYMNKNDGAIIINALNSKEHKSFNSILEGKDSNSRRGAESLIKQLRGYIKSSKDKRYIKNIKEVLKSHVSTEDILADDDYEPEFTPPAGGGSPADFDNVPEILDMSDIINDIKVKDQQLRGK